MSAILLKGNILNFVAHVEDEQLLREILEFCFAKAKMLYPPDGMPPEILAELKEALHRSHDEQYLISNESFKERRKLWLAESLG